MSINISNNAIEWRKYRKKLEKDLFKIRWHQSRSVQQIPRITRTQGSPVKTAGGFAASRGSRRRPQLQTRAGVSQEWTPDSFGDPDAVHASAATPYRLPRLLDGEVANSKPKDYVYKQPLTASHFLLRKDPTTATPVPDCTSPELRIKPNSTKCRPITHSMQTHILYQTWPQGGAKMHRLLPRISKPGGVIVLTEGHSTEPKTPPQSEVEYHLLPTLPLRPSATKHPIHEARMQLGPQEEPPRERKLSWQLSPYSNKNFDRQGLGPNQGPFSREMPVKCMPPSTWLRMKIQRPRLTVAK